MTDTITLPRAVVQGALEALEYGGLLKRRQALTALSEALEQPQQCKRCNAYAVLVKAQEEQLSHHRAQADKYREAISTLHSERQANAALTKELEGLRAEAMQPQQDLHCCPECGCHFSGDFPFNYEKPQEPVAWESGEGWESLAWELCADEHGEEACNELIWEGGPIPEPWGDRWMKYEGEAKRLIALVQKHTAPPRREWKDAAKICWDYHQAGGTAWDCWNALRMKYEAK